MSNNRLNEATTSSSSSGKYQGPLSPGVREFDKQEMQPFYIPTSKYDDAELAYDSYDGKMSTPKNKIKKMETKARKISKYIKDHPTITDDEGNNLNGGNGTTNPLGKVKNIKTPKNENIRDIIKDVLREDLAVWFGTKKKPKGSKQPKGPWVNICRKKEGGGHPPCGRPEASDKGYPKCRAAGVASKMTDSQKKSACQQKRTAEKSHSKSGTGNKPKMTHYKPKNKQNESMKKIVRLTESQLVVLINRIIKEGTTPLENDLMTLTCLNPSDGSVQRINNVIYKNYSESGLSPKLTLSNPPNKPSSSITGEYVISVERPTEKIKRHFNLKDESSLMTYSVGPTKYYCSSKSFSNAWDSFFKEKNIKTNY